jgi:hypothetical protein
MNETIYASSMEFFSGVESSSTPALDSLLQVQANYEHLAAENVSACSCRLAFLACIHGLK